MGFYDARCHATGLSLRAEKAVLVLLLEEPKGTWVPASLPMKGTYNRLGTIDGVQRDFHTELLAESFEAALESKRLVLAGEAAHTWKKPGTDFSGRPLAGIERVLVAVERATTLTPTEVKLSGRRLNHVLLHAGFFEAAGRALRAPEPDVNTSELLARTFPSEQARWLLREVPELTTVRAEARAAMHAFETFCRFLEPRVKWQPSRDLSQHGLEETIGGFATARARFGDLPWAASFLDELEASTEKTEPGYRAGWLRHASKNWIGVRTLFERWVATSPERVRELLEAFANEQDAAFEDVVELFLVKAGVPQPAIDLTPIIRVTAGSRALRLSEVRNAGLTHEDDPKVVIPWEELAPLVPAIPEPALPKGAPALVCVRERPAWAQPEDEHGPLMHFEDAR